MKPSIEEILIDWFGAQSLEIKSIEVETQEIDDRRYLYKATGSFYEAGFDKDDDGARLALEYHQLTLRNWRLADTQLTFLNETEFKIA